MNMTAIEKNNFNQLIENVCNAHYALQTKAQQSVNRFLTERNWLTGYYIVEYEQNGNDRAKYGDNLLEEISKSLKNRGLKGFSARSLYDYRTFYNTYIQISQTLSAKLQLPEYKELIHFEKEFFPISQTVSAELEKDLTLDSDLLLSHLSFSHFLELVKVINPLERLFYEVETIKNNWSIRELKRAIHTSLALRTTLSLNKEAVIAKIKNLKPLSNAEIIRNPYVLEFLDLEEKSEYSESDLENSILNHIQKFLVEMGKGFCFESRQKRITFEHNHYYIDLVFYHRFLKCSILVDLKLNEYHYSDGAQMTLYLNYYKEHEMSEGDNPPIGIILCADKNDTLVKYTTTGMDEQLFVSKYMLNLPDKKQLETILRRELE